MQAGDGRPSYDELAALVVEQARVIAELRARVAALEAENAELKRRLGMNSTELVEAAVVGLAVHQADAEVAAPPQWP